MVCPLAKPAWHTLDLRPTPALSAVEAIAATRNKHICCIRVRVGFIMPRPDGGTPFDATIEPARNYVTT